MTMAGQGIEKSLNFSLPHSAFLFPLSAFLLNLGLPRSAFLLNLGLPRVAFLFPLSAFLLNLGLPRVAFVSKFRPNFQTHSLNGR